jgi:hypothetical protein
MDVSFHNDPPIEELFRPDPKCGFDNIWDTCAQLLAAEGASRVPGPDAAPSRSSGGAADDDAILVDDDSVSLFPLPGGPNPDVCLFTDQYSTHPQDGDDDILSADLLSSSSSKGKGPLNPYATPFKTVSTSPVIDITDSPLEALKRAGKAPLVDTSQRVNDLKEGKAIYLNSMTEARNLLNDMHHKECRLVPKTDRGANNSRR